MEGTAIQVYELMTAEAIFELKEQLQGIIFENTRYIDQQEKTFTISPTSGFLNFTDHSLLWKSSSNNGLPETREEAYRVSETFLDFVNAKTPAFNQRYNSTLRSVFPDRNQRKLKDCNSVVHPDGRWFDHWLCTYEIKMLVGTTGGDSAFVYGMSLDIRVGRNNQVLAFYSRWRPLKRTLYTDLFSHEQFAYLLADEHNEGEAHEEEPQILYLFDGDAGNQYYLAPYYFHANGHHIKLAPASKYSLMVFIGQEHSTTHLRLTAYVYGGSGNYAFNWAYWSSETLWKTETELETVGEGDLEEIRSEKSSNSFSIITLPIGFYTILLNVVDQSTGAYRHHQQIIFSPANSTNDAPIS